jgi:hypothetical protein
LVWRVIDNRLTSILHGTANRAGRVAEDVVPVPVKDNNLVPPPGVALPALVVEDDGEIGLAGIVGDGDAGAALVESFDNLSGLRAGTASRVAGSTQFPLPSELVCPPAAHPPRISQDWLSPM